MDPAAPDSGRQTVEISVIGAICAAAIAGQLSNAQFAPFISEIASDLGRTTPVIGQAATVYLIAAAVAGLVVGPLADRYGHRRALVVGLSLSALSAIGGGLAPSFAVLLITRLVGGLGLAATLGVVFAMVSSRYRGPIRLRALSIVSGALSLTMVAGVPALTGMSTWIAWRGAWIVVGLLAVGAIGGLLAFSPPDPPAEGDRITPGEILRSYLPLLHSRPMLALFGASVSRGVLFTSALTYLGAYFVDELGLSVQEFGLVAAGGGAAFALGSFVAGQLGRVDMRPLFALSTTLAGVWFACAYGFGFAPLATAGLIALAYFFVGVSVVTMLDLLATTTPGGQATTLVINESIFSVGAALGAATGGLLIGLGGYGALALGLPVAALTASLLIWRPGLAAPALAGSDRA